MKLDKETIVKQRFWFLLGGCVPLLLIIWLVLVFGVSGAVTEKRNKYESAKKSLDGINNPKNDSFVKLIDE